MTFNWPKRDEDGRHVTDTGESYIIGECGGPEIKPLSELLAKLDPDVVERAMALSNDEIVNNLSVAEFKRYMLLKAERVIPLKGGIKAKLQAQTEILQEIIGDRPSCSICKGHIRYYTFDYTKGVYVTNYCEHV